MLGWALWMAVNPISYKNHKIPEFLTEHQGAASVSEGSSQRDNLFIGPCLQSPPGERESRGASPLCFFPSSQT